MANHHSRLAAVLALLFFGALAALPWLAQLYQGTQSTAPPSWVRAARHAAVVPLRHTPGRLPAVKISPTARPVRAGDPPASLQVADSSRMAALVAGEDNRLRVLVHHAATLITPVVVPVRGGVSTLVLPARPSTYTLADLQKAHAVVAFKGGGYALVDSVLVASGATLRLGDSGLSTLLMESSGSMFTSLVTWGGTLTLAGAGPQAPLTITGWDQVTNRPVTDSRYGRPYIRAVGGRLDLRYVRGSSLGFWSGRTGGVAWTGVSRRPSTGSAVSSTFTGDTYGAFVSRGDHVQFSDDLFEGNELDGLRLHRNAVGSTVTASAAARNGGNGFVVGRGATGNVLRGDLSTHNQGNGFLLDGQPLVSGASPSGDRTVASSGTAVEGSDAEANRRAGIIVEGGVGTVVSGNIVCGPVTGIAVRVGATGTVVANNEVRCGGRVALSVGPAVTGTAVAGNTLSRARIGLLIRNSPGVRIMDNNFNGISLFGISVRGSSPGVVGDGNVISGLGFQPVDTRGGAPAPQMTNSNLQDWHHRSDLSVTGYLRYHPILTTWLAITSLVVVCWLVIQRVRRPARPYRYAVPWHLTAVEAPRPALERPHPAFASRLLDEMAAPTVAAPRPPTPRLVPRPWEEATAPAVLTGETS
jgi:Right handed beta helix region